MSNEKKLLKISLAVVFLWFGLLKLFGESPVGNIIGGSFSFIAENKILFLLLALFEIALGIGIVLPGKIAKLTAWVMAGHLSAATLGVLFSPQAFTGGFPYLSVTGEFVVKNLVLIAAALVAARK